MTKPASQREIEARVFAEEVRALYAVPLSAQLVFLAAFAALTLIFWAETGPWAGLATGLIYLAGALGLDAQRKAYERTQGEGGPLPWANRHMMWSCTTGAAWALAAILFFPPGDPGDQALLSIVIIAAATASMVVRASHLPACALYVTMIVAPLFIRLSLEGNDDSLAIAGLGIGYCAFLARWAIKLNAERKQAIRFRLANSELMTGLEAARAEAEKGREAAEAGNRAKSEFLAIVSHEIRTPLNAIIGNAQMLSQQELSGGQRDAVDAIREAGEALILILNDILDLSKMEAGRLQLEPVEADPRKIVQGVMRMLQSRAWEKKLALSAEIDERVPATIAADPGRLRQILLNLAGNAIKFTEHGGVKIRVETEGGDGGRPERLRFAVSDTGIGIPQDALDKLFLPFTQLDQSFARRHNGTGLGLALCKRLVGMMGGKIGVASEVGQGTEFWFSIPIYSEAPSREAPTAPDEPATARERPGRLRALVAEDSLIEQKLLEHILTREGHEIAFVGDGFTAVEEVAKGGFDFVVMDIGMPGLSGTEAIRMIRALPGRGRDIPILALTAHGPDVLARAGLKDAVDFYLRKPITPASFANAVAKIVTAKRRPAEPAAKTEKPALDTAQIARLAKNIGEATLVDVLQSYLGTVEEILARLDEAVAFADAPATGRAARDLAGTSADLGLVTLSAVSRALANTARQDGGAEKLAGEAETLKNEAARAREALIKLYPDLAVRKVA